MRIALIGYGKMGKAIEDIAIAQGYTILFKFDIGNQAEFTIENLQQCDVAIEFTSPHSAVNNLKKCFDAGVPVVCGSTGWLAQWDDIVADCTAKNAAMVYASNYSIGVNLFFELNIYLATLMNKHTNYDVMLDEIHHTEKKDAPSGTAITLAEQVLQNITNKTTWVNNQSTNPDELTITSKRIDPAPGTHKITYHSPIDDIEITHTAHNRMGFAGGAVLAAAFIVGKKGVYNMKQVLGL